MRRAHWLVLVILAAPLATAQGHDPISLEGEQDWNLQTLPRTKDGAFDFAIGFSVDQDRDAYLKVLPTSWNPAFYNGTIGGAGWWTEVFDMSGDAATVRGSTNGTTLVELGSYEGNVSHRLRVRVHAPAAALDHEETYRLSYALAVRPAGDTSGSGGNLDPSVSLLPVLQIYKDAPGDASVKETGGPAPLFWGMVAGAILVVSLVAVVLVRRRRKDRAQGAT